MDNKAKIGKRQKRGLHLAFILFTFITVIIAAYLGHKKEAGMLENSAASLIPEGCEIRTTSDSYLLCYRSGEREELAGIIASHNANGYSGPMEIGVLVDTNGVLQELSVLLHRETPSYYSKIEKSDLSRQLKGLHYTDPFESGRDYDIISGATYTTKGIVSGARQACHKAAVAGLNKPPVPVDPPKVQFGIPEITLILLYLMVLLALQTRKKVKKAIRWSTLILGMVILGFWYGIPLSLNRINIFLLGFWPQWQNSLYWYMLIISVFGLVLITGKRWYCNWFCPFLAVQECIAVIGGGRIRIPLKWQRGFSIFQRTLAWIAILAALYYRSPSIFNYGVFGASFNLTGSVFLFSLLGLFLVASLFIKRPYCHILCPVNAINDLLDKIRTLIVRS